MAGQVAYHLMSQARLARAPWGITTCVACLPVLLLGMAAALAHMRHADTHRQDQEDAGQVSAAGSQPAGNRPGEAPVQARSWPDDMTPSVVARPEDDQGAETERLEIARVTALQLVSTGMRVSRRTLRDAGLRGSNAELGALVRAVSAELDRDYPDDQQAPPS